MSMPSGRTAQTPGTGQGLWLVSAIREAGGYSQEGLARELGVSFPTVNSWERGRSRPRRRHLEALESLAQSLGIRTDLAVLVIDDDPLACQLIEEMIKVSPTHVEVHTTTDSSEGLLLCGALRPDLLLLDIMMPGLNGFELAEKLADLDPSRRTHIAFVTASTDPAVDERAARTGHALFRKPITQKAIDHLLSRLGDQEKAS